MIGIRAAISADADGMSAVLEALRRAGKRKSAADATFVRRQYIDHDNRIACSVAVDDLGAILGFQSLQIVTADNPYGAPDGWGVIGTHLHPDVARRGIGRALFAVTRKAAVAARLPAIEAMIGAENEQGLGYYAAMGFTDYRSAPGAVGKKLVLAA